MTVVVLLVMDVVLLLVLASMCCVPLVVAGVGVTAFDVVPKPDLLMLYLRLQFLLG